MAQENEKLQAALTAAFDEFTTLLDSFDERDINDKPAPASWTPAQVAIHIILATDGVPDHTTGQTSRAIDALLPAIRPWWEDYNQKFESPEPLRPDDKPRTKCELLDELKRVKEKDIRMVKHDDLALLCMDFELPTVGYLTRYEWLWFIQMHLKRHSYQLKNMRAVYAQG